MSLKVETMIGVWVRVEGTNDEVAEFMGWCGPRHIFAEKALSTGPAEGGRWQTQGFYPVKDARRIEGYIEARRNERSG